MKKYDDWDVNMKYMGSKSRIAKYILPIMLKGRKSNQYWVEPFVGGGNMIDKVVGNRIGADIDYWAIQALISIRDNVNELPKNNKEFTEEDYRDLRKNDNYKFKGYAGYAFSWGAKWLGGWCRGEGRDYVAESYRNAIKQSPKIKGIKFIQIPYFNLEIPYNSIIYCDPPYQDTTKYNDNFNHQKFWEWCRQKINEGHKVFVSEYNAPDDFKCIWKGKISSFIRGNKSDNRIEKLFTKGD